MPPGSGSFMKVLVADQILHRVVYVFRVAPGVKAPPHRHYCHACAYTICGEGSYETGPAPEGALAYEPESSEHSFTSGGYRTHGGHVDLDRHSNPDRGRRPSWRGGSDGRRTGRIV